MERYKTGKRPARHGAVKFHFSDFFDKSKLPKPPAAFGHHGVVAQWHMLGNDRYSNCVWAGAAHETMMWSVVGGAARARFTIHDTLVDYAACAGFDPDDPATDNGTDMQAAASYRRKTGILDALGARHRIDSYVAIKPGDVDETALAIYLTAAAGIGLRMPASAEDQFDAGEPWHIVANDDVAGGHYVSGVGRAANGNFVVVTWGRTQEMTPEYAHKYCDEAIGYLSIEALKDALSPEGFDAAGLRAYLKALAA